MNIFRCAMTLTTFVLPLYALMASNDSAAAQVAPPSPYAAWTNGPPSDPSYFPIAVWLQSPQNAKKYKAAGINLYIGLWQGPTEEQLAALKAAEMPVICEQNAVGLAHKDDKIIVGWMHGDEPDNAQPVKDPATGKQGWGGPVPPAQVVAHYEEMRAADPTRPILLNLGQGVANDQWIGRGTGARPDDYLTYVKAGDMISFDVYPVASLDENKLWYVPKGVDRLLTCSGGKKIVWNCIEASRIDNEKTMVTPAQLRSEIWMSLVHGSTGLIYFVHQFKPRFNEHALLDDPVLLPAATAINKQIQELAPVLNSPTIANAASVQSSNQAPIDIMVKKYKGAVYLFTVGMRNEATRGTFVVPAMGANATVEVMGENRDLIIRNGHFEDEFKPYDVHLYRIQM
jgi:hypothetical protein